MRTTLKAVVIVGALLCAPATAAAAEKPVVTTGAATSIEPTTATLNGFVTPKGATTTYYFQFGTSSLYGSVTPAATVAAGSGRVKVTAAVGRPGAGDDLPLPPGRPELAGRRARQPPHVQDQEGAARLLGRRDAESGGGRRRHDARRRAVRHGRPDRRIIVKSNPWPYTQGFLPVGNELVTNDDGSFSVPVLSVPVNTQFRVEMVARPDIVSTPLTVGATLDVTRRVKVTRGDRRGRLRFRGRISPAVDGEQVLIQKLRLSDGVWITVGETFARNNGDSSSRYRKSIRQRRGGRYRVLVNVDEGTYSPSSSRSIRRRHIRD